MPGGPSLYTAVAAHRLGADVTLVTGMPPGFDRSALQGIFVLGEPVAGAPRYANSYDPHGNRRQLLLAPGVPLAVPARLPPSDALVLAPAYHELDEWRGPFPAGLTVAALQGALRTAGPDSSVTPHGDPAAQAMPFLSANYLFLSTEDTPDSESFARECSKHGPSVFLTRGADGAELFRDGQRTLAIRPLVASAADPTGAGDCFLAAFVVRLIETGDEAEASRFAAAAGALAVEGSGVNAIPGRTAIERRVREVAA